MSEQWMTCTTCKAIVQLNATGICLGCQMGFAGQQDEDRYSPDVSKDSSGNVFQDIGLPDAEGCLAKAEIASLICVLIKKKKLTQERVAELLKITQHEVSHLLSGRLEEFSLEKLVQFLNYIKDRDKELEDAIQKPKTKSVHVQPKAKAGKRVRKGNAKGKKVTKESKEG